MVAKIFVFLSLLLGLLVNAQESITLTVAVATPESEALELLAEHYMAANPHTVSGKDYTITVTILEPSESGDALKDAFILELDKLSPTPDIFQVELTWLGDMWSYLLSLNPEYLVGLQSKHFATALEAATSPDDTLVALPWSLDAGLLYYRSDLLKKYGFSAPPQSWLELATMAQAIQIGERGAGKADFWGYLWQGGANEDLTSNALEWLASNNAGTIISSTQDITVNNLAALDMLEQAASWLGTISPEATTDFSAADSSLLWQAGQAAFMRNWYSQKPKSVQNGLFGLAPLPVAKGSGVATLGGYYLAISKASLHPDIATDFLLFSSSYEEQKMRAIRFDMPPSLKALYQDQDVLLNNPSLVFLTDAFDHAVLRPAMPTVPPYHSTSRLFAKAVHNVLTQKSDAKTALEWLELDLQDLTGFSTRQP